MGMLHIYCGDGKGKTTAALGLAIRAAGSGMRVDFVQFLKYGEDSELDTISKIPEITVFRCKKKHGFTYQLSDQEKEYLTKCNNQLLHQESDRLSRGLVDMVVLDEFFAAYNCGVMDKALANRLVLTRRDTAELVLTGRDPEQKFIDAADYVSEIRAVKHPYTKGTSARKGIEY